MGFFDKIFYTNAVPKVHHLLNLYRLSKKRELSNNFDLEQTVKGFENICVVASGPSANDLTVCKNTLYITTNSSYMTLDKNANFIHILKDPGYINRYLLFDIKYKPLCVILDIDTVPNSPKYAGALILKKALKFLEKKKRKYPVVMTNNERQKVINPRNYSSEIIKFLDQHNLSQWWSNSGEMIYKYGLWLSTLDPDNYKPLLIYGLDAGEGSNFYADGRKLPENHVISGNNNKEHMRLFLGECQSRFKNIRNYSYFLNNTTK